MIDAIVSRKSSTDHRYLVIPGFGGGMVEAIDIHRIGNFAQGEKVNIIQVGDSFGIAKRASMLRSVLEVPDRARMGLAELEPAQFFCAYLGAQLGRFRRYYDVGVVTQEGDGHIRVKSNRQESEMAVLSFSGIRPSDFQLGDTVLIRISDSGSVVVGWWALSDQVPEGDYPRGSAWLWFALRTKAGSAITGDAPASVYFEYGEYVYDENNKPTGEFTPFSARETIICEKIGGILTAKITFISFPNEIRLTYFHDGDWLVKTFSIEALPISITSDAGLFRYSGNEVWFESYEAKSFSMTDFSGILPGMDTEYDLDDPHGYGVRVIFDQSSILQGPDESYGYISVGLKNAQITVQTTGSASIGASVDGSSGGVYLTTDGQFRVTISATGQARGELRTIGTMYGEASYDHTTIISCSAEVWLTYDLTAKAYVPAITNKPPWIDGELPAAFVASSAGTIPANGAYALNSGMYLHSGGAYAVGYVPGEGWYLVSLGDFTVLYINTGGSETTLPKTGWQIVEGSEPAPTLEY